jgi:hypothetical protein
MLLRYRGFGSGGNMAREQKGKESQPALKYRRVDVSGLDRGRRGKHHDLIAGILGELQTAPAGAALEIPLADVGVELANLRSAVHRAATNKGLSIETLADTKSLYVWRTAE